MSGCFIDGVPSHDVSLSVDIDGDNERPRQSSEENVVRCAGCLVYEER